MARCTCPHYNIPDARPLNEGECPVHAPWKEGNSPEERAARDRAKLEDRIKIRDEALRIVTGGDAELIASLVVQARDNLGIEEKG